jgi:hypothetical protein
VRPDLGVANVRRDPVAVVAGRGRTLGVGRVSAVARVADTRGLVVCYVSSLDLP